MIEARPFDPAQIQRAYDRRSRLYGKLVAPFEFRNHRRAIEKANIRATDKVLEVAVGPGRAFLEIVKRLDRNNIAFGVDAAPGMLTIARRTIEAAGYANFDLSEGDARKLHFDNDTFDVLYNAYMLDLIPFADIPDILAEFRRVLKPGGRVVVLNMSKRDDAGLSWYERLYRRMPAAFVLNVMGACRPVLMAQSVSEAGFANVEREFIGGVIPSEIITAAAR